MTLGEQQRIFIRQIADLIVWAYDNGYELSAGDFFRDSRAFGMPGAKGPYGNPNSNHKRRLAADLNLFINGVYQSDSAAYKPLGDYWKSLDPMNRWGGDFPGDGNHFSREWKGYK